MTRVLSASDSFVAANDAFEAGDYTRAISLFSQAIAADPSRYEFLVRRSVAYQRAGDHQESLNDANECIRLVKGKRAHAKTEVKALLRKGIAEFNLKRFGNAYSTFKTASEKDPDEKTNNMWLKKCEIEFEKGASNEVVPESASQKTKQTSPSLPDDACSTENQSATTAQIPTAAPNIVPKIRHEWYQNDQNIMISIFVKKVAPQTVDITFTERALSISFPLVAETSFSLELDPLAHEIIPEQSSYEVLSTKIEVKLKKKMAGLKWGVLEGEDALGGVIAHSEDSKPSYPSSAIHRKDWNKLEKEVEEDKPEGEAALNALFQTIYKDASDETRRAMMKSYVESNGTCLSTNWDEVGKKKVECTPPDGMEAKKFDI